MIYELLQTAKTGYILTTIDYIEKIVDYNIGICSHRKCLIIKHVVL